MYMVFRNTDTHMIKVISGTTGPLAEKLHAQCNPASPLSLEEQLFLRWKTGDTELGRASRCKSLETESEDLPELDVAIALKRKLQRWPSALPHDWEHAWHCS